ncbi:sialate O-acetylesterase [Sphingomonas aerolata]|uniref:sialate O-acetylesterase n=1 Tax=Sphingomonas aerolata TaxID=185951 RepID=UPI0035A628A2
MARNPRFGRPGGGRRLTSLAAAVVIVGGGVIVTPTPTPSPTILLSSASPKLLSNAPGGTLIAKLTGVPAGVTPVVAPNDGRFAIAGDATNGWKVVVGLTAISAGSVNLTVSATGVGSASATLNIIQFLGYHRFASWGQSNEIGRNGPIDAILDAPDYRIYSYGFDSQTVTQANLQLDYQDETTNTVGPIMSFAKAYIAAGNLPDGFALLIVPVAKGNTAFSTGFWDADGAGDTAAIARMNAAAALASGAWIVASGTLGEGDRTQTQAYFATKLDALIVRWRANVTDAANMPFLMGGLLVGGSQTAAPIVAALQDLPNRVAFTGYISSEGLTGGVDGIHFDAASNRMSGQRRYAGLAAAKANNLAPAVPAQVTGLSATPSSGQVALAWIAPSSNRSAITDYMVEAKPSTSTVWTTFADGTGTTTNAIVTGLTDATAYDFRVTAVNAVGPGTPSTTASATPSAAPVGGLVATFVGADNTPASTITTDSGHSISQTTGVSQIRNNALAGTTVPSEGTFSYVPPSILQHLQWRTIVNTKAGNAYMKYRQNGADYFYAGCGSNGAFHTLASFVGGTPNNFAGANTATPAFNAGDTLDYDLVVTSDGTTEVHTLKVSVNSAAAVQVISGTPGAAALAALAGPGTVGFRQSGAASSGTVGLQLDNIRMS